MGAPSGADRTTEAQNAAVYDGIADLLFDVMGKPREDTTVIFHEYGIKYLRQGSLPLRDYRAPKP